MKTELTFEIMEKILPDICTLFDDSELQNMKADIRKNKLSTGAILSKLIPAFISRHRAETIRIIAAISGKSEDEIEKQDFKQTITDMNGGLLEQMIDFFGWCLRLVLKM